MASATPDMVDEFTRDIALEALELSKKVERDQKGHEDLCAERYTNIGNEIAKLHGIFKWMGGAAFTVLLFTLGIIINQMNTANQALAERNNAALMAATRIERLEDALTRERQKNEPAPPMGQR